jgi:hypothetical protein
VVLKIESTSLSSVTGLRRAGTSVEGGGLKRWRLVPTARHCHWQLGDYANARSTVSASASDG